MLIPSSRHRSADLALWVEMEEADRVHGERLLLSGKIEESIAAIREFVARGPCYAGTSWGKDSVVLCHLLRMTAPDVPFLHLRPTNHNPDCDAVRDAFLTNHPDCVYSEVPVDYGTLHAQNLPHQDLDAATDRLWYAAIRRVGEKFDHRHILGIRAEESSGRRFRCLRWGLSSKNGCAPLGWWTTADVFGYLAVRELPVHPAYAMLGAGRWPRERIRVAEIGDTHGAGGGRNEWEQEYYGDVLRWLKSSRHF